MIEKSVAYHVHVEKLTRYPYALASPPDKTVSPIISLGCKTQWKCSGTAVRREHRDGGQGRVGDAL